MTPRRDYHFHSQRSGAALTLQVIPGARQARIDKIRSDGCLVVHLDHGASDESCHPALVKFLSGVFSVKPSQLEIIVEGSDGYKIVSILGMDSARVDGMVKNLVKKKA
jgi:uncharacterized protein YggU (UPF0235/DUF167 family)